MTGPVRLLVVGAGGRTGGLLCRVAAGEGHHVTTLSRRPVPDGLAAVVHRQIVGDARDAAVVGDAVRGQDVVVTAVAARGRGPGTTVRDVTHAVLTAMGEAGVGRLVVTSSRNVVATRPWIAVAPTRWFFRHVYDDLARAEELVVASGLDWTIVRAVMLTDAPSRGGVHVDHEADATGGHWTLPRADYARALLDAATDPATVGRRLGVNGLAGRGRAG